MAMPHWHHAPATRYVMQDTAALIGRVLMAILFVPSGWEKIAGFSGTVAYATSAGLPLPQVSVGVALVLELVGGLMLLLGLRLRWAAVALAVYTVVAALFFHQYWAAPEAQRMTQEIMFMKNLAVAGGLLAFAAYGAGRFSADRAYGWD